MWYKYQGQVTSRAEDGRLLKMLTVIDEYSRECLAIKVGRQLRSQDVFEQLGRLFIYRGMPGFIRSDNGPEFTAKAMDQWAHWNQILLDFSRPGKPTDNAMIESFNGRLRQECLSQNWFLSLQEARKKLESWRMDYNQTRPHSSLGNRTPEEFRKSGSG